MDTEERKEAQGYLCNIREMREKNSIQEAKEYILAQSMEFEDGEWAIFEDALKRRIYRPKRFELLLGFGGPSCRIIGEMSGIVPKYDTVSIQMSYWGVPFHDCPIDDEQKQDLIWFCKQFRYC